MPKECHSFGASQLRFLFFKKMFLHPMCFQTTWISCRWGWRPQRQRRQPATASLSFGRRRRVRCLGLWGRKHEGRWGGRSHFQCQEDEKYRLDIWKVAIGFAIVCYSFLWSLHIFASYLLSAKSKFIIAWRPSWFAKPLLILLKRSWDWQPNRPAFQ